MSLPMLRKLGIAPPDTPFNRRAAKYAKAAVREANAQKCREKKIREKAKIIVQDA